MNLSHLTAAQSTWISIEAAALDLAGFASPLYRAALRARLGKDLEGEEFAVLASRLPVEDRARLLASIEERV